MQLRRVAVVGTGALGTLFANALRPVIDVVALGRGTGLPSVLEVDLVLLAVKTYDTVAAVRALLPALGPEVPLLSLQNGLDAVGMVDAAGGARHPVALAPTSEGATLVAPGEVRRAGPGITTLGWAEGREGSLALERIAAMFAAAGLVTRIAAPIEPYVWAKLVANAAINPVCALAGKANGFLLASSAARERAARLANESAAVARAAGIVLPFEDPVAYMLEIARSSAANRSSMLEDLARGRPTEIEALNGAILRRARELGVEVPETERILDEVRRRGEA